MRILLGPFHGKERYFLVLNIRIIKDDRTVFILILRIAPDRRKQRTVQIGLIPVDHFDHLIGRKIVLHQAVCRRRIESVLRKYRLHQHQAVHGFHGLSRLDLTGRHVDLVEHKVESCTGIKRRSYGVVLPVLHEEVSLHTAVQRCDLELIFAITVEDIHRCSGTLILLHKDPAVFEDADLIYQCIPLALQYDFLLDFSFLISEYDHILRHPRFRRLLLDQAHAPAGLVCGIALVESLFLCRVFDPEKISLHIKGGCPVLEIIVIVVILRVVSAVADALRKRIVDLIRDHDLIAGYLG